MKICVRVSCRCSFSADWLYFPKDIVGIHRIDKDDPRNNVGAKWATKGEHCQGYMTSQSCEEGDCNPFGEVVELYSECDICPFKNEAAICPLLKGREQD